MTARGVILIPVAWWTLRNLALQQHDRLLLAATTGGLCLLIAIAMVVFATAIALRWMKTPALSDIRGMETVEISTGLVLPVWVSLPCIAVDIRWLNFEGVDVSIVSQQGCLHERARPSQRGQRDELVRQFEIGDVFGLSRVKFQRTFPQSVRIEPLPAVNAAVTQVRRDQQGDDLAHPNGKPHGDLIEMRHYRPGDPLKLVLWKHYARTKQLLVRQPEKSIACMTQTIACFVAGPGDQASAGVARTILTELTQAGEELLFQADGASRATDCAFEALDQIIQSADMRVRGGGIIAALGATMPSNVIRHCIAFVPSQPGPWIDHVIAGKTASHWEIDAVIGVDEPISSKPHRFLPSWTFRKPSAELVQLDEVQSVVSRLTQAGIATRIIHRRSGQPISTISLRGQSA
ncbi:hypothetical protein Pla100_49100 [Neorhodopirellula pilleata]|uniref:Uncharacterized protein n=1 Tax=Neorhodopirellula pilleata TaxID=2714738 RepID=A0A5C5ZW92_9BACT|nr:hypothetical protein Pla100_49100 [Neorhodopirellula pilleata]